MPESSSTLEWENLHEGVWRLRSGRLRFTVSRTAVHREWLWVVERTNGMGHTSERARGRTYLLRQAKALAPSILFLLEQFEREQSQARYIPADGSSSSVEAT